jgi:hypothetical protein
MTTAATHHEQSNTTEARLFVAFELREKTWKLGFTTGHGQKPRERTMTARHHERGSRTFTLRINIADLSRGVGVGSMSWSFALATRCQDLPSPFGLSLHTPPPFNLMLINGYRCLDPLRLGPRRHAEHQHLSHTPHVIGQSCRHRGRARSPHLGRATPVGGNWFG